MTTRTATTSRADAMSVHLTQTGSCWAWRTRAVPGRAEAGDTASVLMAEAPALEAIDDHEHRERDGQQHRRDGGGLAVRELLQAGHDQDGRDLRLVRHVPGHEDDGAVLADAAGEGEGEA